MCVLSYSDARVRYGRIMTNQSVVEINNTSVKINTTSVHRGNLLHCVEEESLILIMAVVIWVLGVIGNTATFFKIVLNKRLRRPVSVSIACLTVADFCSLCLQFIRVPISQCFFLTSVGVKMIVLDITAVAIHSSTMHIIILAAIRYSLIVYPFHTKWRLTSGKVIASSGVSWAISVCLGISYGIYNRKYYNETIDKQTDAIVQLLIGLYVLLVPVTFFVIFYIKELQTMKKSLLPKRTSKSIKSVSKMIWIILILYCVFILPYVVADLCRVLYLHNVLGDSGDGTVYKSVVFPIYSVAQITVLLNYTVNPFIYFLFSRMIFRVRSWSFRSKLSYRPRKCREQNGI